jgi:hypothetical protein
LVDSNTVADEMGLCVAFQKRFEDFLRDSHTPFFDRCAATILLPGKQMR